MGLSEEKEKVDRSRDAVRNIIIWPESKREYETFQGYEVEVVDTRKPDKGVYVDKGTYPYKGSYINGDMGIWDTELRNHLIDNGVEALVNAQYWKISAGEAGDVRSEGYYGLPVRRKREK